MNFDHLKRAALAAVAAATLVPIAGHAQPFGPPPPPEPAASPRARPAIDMTGNWVAIVNEDWRWRMLTAPKGDFIGLPMTPAGRAAAEAWDPASDGSCKAYGVGGLMRMPTRLKIDWVGDDVIKIETDAGGQTRLLNFKPAPPNTPASLQGYSVAEWRRPGAPSLPGPGAGNPGVTGGSLKVTTAHTTGGWVRRNGVPYSQNAVVTEYFDQFKAPDGSEWLTVLTIINDPINFRTPFTTSSHFRKEPDAAKWRVRPCRPD